MKEGPDLVRTFLAIEAGFGYGVVEISVMPPT